MMAVKDNLPYYDLMIILMNFEEHKLPISFNMFTQYPNTLMGMINYLYFMERWLDNKQFRSQCIDITLYFEQESHLNHYINIRQKISSQ